MPAATGPGRQPPTTPAAAPAMAAAGRPALPGAARAAAAMATATAIGMSGYHLATAALGPPVAEMHRSIHLAFVLAIVAFSVLAGGAAPRRRREWLRDGLGAATILAGIVAALYVAWNADEIQNRIFYVYDLVTAEKVLAALLLVGVSEAARRSLGVSIVVLMWAFVAYAFLGQHLPLPYGHRGFSASRILEQVYITKDGLWGGPLGISASFMFMFVLFGALLTSTGSGKFFTDVATRATSGWTGGPAKAAVIASALMSLMSGNAASNVATTGVVTIPTMVRAGYRKEFAAGVEAVASSGGQITPPVMGAAAFLMVEFVGVSYATVMASAVVPAALYFIALLAMVHFEARRLNLGAWRSEIALDRLHTLVQGTTVAASLAVIVAMMVRGYTPTMAALWGVAVLVALTGLRRLLTGAGTARDIADGLASAATMIAPVALACAIGGLIAGITVMTGLGVKISELVLLLSGGSVLAALALTMVVAVVMGMGLPSSSAYIILAALLAPSLVKMGVPLIAAHMFILFCGVSSTITPPVAIASYTAAAIADANPWRTSLVAFRLGLSIYLVPFMFVATPGLLMQGDAVTIALNALTATAGVLALSAAIIGHATGPLRWWQRAALFAGALMLIHGAAWSDIAGIAIAAAALAAGRAGAGAGAGAGAAGRGDG